MFSIRSPLLAHVAVALCVIWTSGAGWYPFDVQYAFGTKSELATLTQYLALAVGMLFVAVQWRPAALRLPAGLLWLLFFAACSLAWSIAPDQTLASLFRLSVVTLVVSLAMQRLPNAVGSLFNTLLVLVVVGCLLAAIGSPYALMSGDHSGDWRGFFAHKNILGYVVAFVACLGLYPDISRLRFGRLFWVVIGFVLLKVGSATAIVSVCLGAAIYTGLRLLARSSPADRLPLVTAGLLLAGLLLAGANDVLSFLGRDFTFTGRTDIWAHFFEAYLQSWMGGTGFGTQSFQFDLIERIRYIVGWSGLGTPHNSYLYIFGELGLPGVAAFVLLNLAAMGRLLKLAIGANSPYHAMLFATLCVLSVYRIFESSLTFGPTIGMVLNLVILCAAFGRRSVIVAHTVRLGAAMSPPPFRGVAPSPHASE